MSGHADRSHALTASEAAELLGVSRRTIYNLVARGQLPCYRVGTTTRFRRSTLEAWIENQENHASLPARERPVVQQLLGGGPDDAGRPPPIPPAPWGRPDPKRGGGAERRLHAEIEAQVAGRPATSRAGPSRSESPGPPVVADLPSASFSGLAAKWLEVAVAPKRKPKTYQFYEYICRVWLVPYFGDREASSITPVDVEALQAHIARTPRKKNNEAGGKAPPGPKTNNEILGCLSSMLATAKRWRYLRSNPCDDVDRMAVPRARLAYYNAHDTARWLATCQQIEPDWYAFFLAGFRTGLREGELFALRVDDVDLDARQLTVSRTYGAAAEREEGTGRAVPVYLEGTPKSGTERVVGISGMLVEVLRGHIGMRRAGHVWSRRARNDGDAHLRLSNIVGPWRRVTEAAGLPAYSIHAMRHSFASQLVMAGVPLTHVQALLGHSTIKMTERYAHLAPGFASGHVDVLDTVPVTPGRPNSTSEASRPNKVVGVTGFEPVTPTV